MTNAEFSNEFDILYNNIMSNQAPGLDNYEKSVFLTKAQEELIISLYKGKLSLESFESTEELRRYLSSLNVTTVKKPVSLDEGESKLLLTTTSSVIELPKDVMFITYEMAKVNDRTIIVVPTTQDEYNMFKNNPFKRPNNRRVFRIDIGNNRIELVSNGTISEYYIKYLERPKPIILEDLQEGYSINSISKEMPCGLPEMLHRAILDRAVQLAKISMKNS